MPQNTQKRNPQLINLLRSDFRHITDPTIMLRNTANLGTPPTDANLDNTAVGGPGAPSTLPENMVILYDANGAGTNMYLVVSDKINNKWWYVALTAAP